MEQARFEAGAETARRLDVIRPCILLAEDDVDFRRLLAFTLQADNYLVEEFSTGEELLLALERRRADGDLPAMVISDLRMPKLSGLQVFEAVRSWGWEIPLIVITAFCDDRVRAEAKQIGAAAVFSKPFDLDDIRTAVRIFLGRGLRRDAPAG